MLKVKEYIKRESLENIDERLTQAFVEYISGKSDVIYEVYDSRFFSTKLNTRLILKDGFPLSQIYSDLVSIVMRLNVRGIAISGLSVTPVIIDLDSKEEVRGIIACIKYIR